MYIVIDHVYTDLSVAVHQLLWTVADVPTESCQLLEEGIPPVVAEPEHATWKPPASVSNNCVLC